MDPEIHSIPPKGWSGFLQEAVKFIRKDRKGKNALAKHDLNYKLVLDTPDWPNSALLVFKNKDVFVYPVDKDIIEDTSQWDTRMTLPAPVAVELFIGNLKPMINGLFHGKIKLKRPLQLRKVLWFVNFSIGFYKNNKGLARAMFWKMYNMDQ